MGAGITTRPFGPTVTDDVSLIAKSCHWRGPTVNPSDDRNWWSYDRSVTATAPRSGPRTVRAPRGTEISCKGWQQEAALRMLMNNLDPDVAEDPDHLIVYGGTGRAARSWEAFDAIVRELQRLENDETLLVQSGKPVGVFRTTDGCPARPDRQRQLLVPHWATWEQFRELERAGLTMYGQMTAGSWIYIATQGIIQGTYETFAEAARQHFSGCLRGTAHPDRRPGRDGRRPAAGGDHERGRLPGHRGGPGPRRAAPCRRLRRRGHRPTSTRRSARVDAWRAAGEARSIALIANAADVEPELVRRGWHPDLVTDQTSAHDPLGGYVPGGIGLAEARELRERDPAEYTRRSMASMADHVRAMLAFQASGSVVFDYGNNIRAYAREAGVDDRLRLPGLRAGLHPAALLRGQGSLPLGRPVRRPRRHPEDRCGPGRALPGGRSASTDGCAWPRRRSRSRACRPGSAGWATGSGRGPGCGSTRWCASGELAAPIVIGRDHLDAGSVASPYRETEGMRDGSDAIADWPILNALLNTAAGATWVSFHHGGGVGIGYSLHAGMVIVADGTPEAAARLERVLTTDPGMGVIRHADAGYERALEVARERGVRVPMASELDRPTPG